MLASNRSRFMFMGALLGLASVCAQDQAGRQELARAGLVGSAEMEVIQSMLELRPGEQIGLHTHPGVETVYVLQGGQIQSPGQAVRTLVTGSSLINPRDQAHGGFTVVGDQTIRLLTVHVVERGKPLYEWVAAPSQ